MPTLHSVALSQAAKSAQPQPFLLTDRVRYHGDDPVLHLVGSFSGASSLSAWSLILNSVDPPSPDVTLLSHTGTGPLPPEFELLLESSIVGGAAPAPFAKFRLRINDGTGAQVLLSNEFDRVPDLRHKNIALPPAGIPIVVEQTSADGDWPVTTGVPFPKGAITDPARLALFDAAGTSVPAQFQALAEWYPAVGTNRSVKWISLDFIAKCRKNGSTAYTLRGAAPPPAPGGWVTDGPTSISVATGSIRFTVRKQGFNGIDSMERHTGTGWRSIAQGGIGPYLEVREKGDTARTAVNRIRFTAKDDPTATVQLIKNGDVCAVIRAEGDYYHAAMGSQWEDPGGPIDTDAERRHCHFVIDITAYRGSNQINIASTLIITYDPGNVREDLSTAIPDAFFSSQQERSERLGSSYTKREGQWWKQPVDIGWDWGLASSFERGWLGYDTGNGNAVWPAEPWAEARVSLHQFAPDRCSVVVEAFDALRRDVRRVAGGIRSEGWATADLGADAFTVALRDVWQRFPKEISLSREGGGRGHLTVHTWPRHGIGPEDRFHGSEIFSRRSGNVAVVPDETDDSLLRTRIWKLPFAHEGDAMDLRVPTPMVRRWIELHRGPLDRGWDQDEDIAGAVSRTAQGLATTTEMAFFVHDGSSAQGSLAVHQEARRVASFWQGGVHALANPQWNGDTRAEGRFDAPSSKHAAIEKGSSRAVESWQQGLGGIQGCYGMWIHGSLHDNWMTNVEAGRSGVDQRVGIPKLIRIWQASHYRNVWMAWLLYLRSGDSMAREWALATSRLYADVGTMHKGPYNNRQAGDMAHCYSITPWGTQYGPQGHWIDPDAHRLRFCLTGDRYALRLYHLWWQALSRKAPYAGLGRESTNTFGAVADYYAFTHDPSAMVLVRTIGPRILADRRLPGATTYPFYALSDFVEPVWNRRWLEQYHDLTGDIDAVRLAVDLVEQGDTTPQIAAFAFLEMQSGGLTSPGGIPIASYLERHIAGMWDKAVRVLDTGSGPYHGHGDHFSAAYSYWLQEWPYFAHALSRAQLSTPGEPGRGFVPPGIVSTSPSAPHYERIAYPIRYRGGAAQPGTALEDWARASITVYVLAGASFDVNLLLQGGTNVKEFRGYLRVYRHDPGAALGPWILVVPQAGIGLSVTFSVAAQVVVSVQPHIGPQTLYQVHLLASNAGPVKAPLTALPEVFELRGPAIGPQTHPDRIGGWIEREAAHAFGRQLWYVAAAKGTSQRLTIITGADYGWTDTTPGWPCPVLLQNAKGTTVAPRQVVPPLPPLGPYEYNGRIGPAAVAGQSIPTGGGLYQLASFLDDDRKAQAAFVVNAPANSPARFFSTGAYGPVLRLEGRADRAYLALDKQHLQAVLDFISKERVPLIHL